MPSGSSRTQIALHWIVAALILGQLVFGEDMKPAFRALTRNGVAEMGLMVWGHIVAGIAVLLFAMWRLLLRADRGVPGPPAGEPAMLSRAGHISHLALYALLIVMPMTGIVAWFGVNHAAGEVHEWIKPVLIVLVVAHVAATLWHRLWRKDDVLQRMLRADH